LKNKSLVDDFDKNQESAGLKAALFLFRNGFLHGHCVIEDDAMHLWLFTGGLGVTLKTRSGKFP
jgi:hypothetical protein